MKRIIMFASGKGGVGKSSLSSALAYSMASRGLRTLLVDADFGLRSLDLMLGMQDKVLYELSDCLKRRCSLQDALLAHPEQPLLKLLVGGQQTKPKDFEARDLAKMLKTLSPSFDVILVDGPAGLGRGIKLFYDIAKAWVLVATPDNVCLRATEKTAQMLMQQGAERPWLLINRLDAKLLKSGELSRPEDLALALDLPLLGTIPQSEEAYRLLLKGKSLTQAEDQALSGAIDKATDRLLGLEQPQPAVQPLSAWQRFLRFFRDKEVMRP